ncbi:MAG: crossover junction endodeoxyribonuclease RuvC [Gammaproteobacteria bacterium]
MLALWYADGLAYVDATTVTRILGVDPGSRTTGYGVLDAQGNRLQYLTCGGIVPKGETLPERLGEIFTHMRALIEEYRPDEMAIEEVFMHRNPQSAIKLGQARGAAIVAASAWGVAVFEYSATQIKQSTTGRGHAAKEQVQHMIRVLLNLSETPQSDAADALAVAVSHAHYRETAVRVSAASGTLSELAALGRRRGRGRSGGRR